MQKKEQGELLEVCEKTYDVSKLEYWMSKGYKVSTYYTWEGELPVW